MATINVSRSGASLGAFPEDEVRAGLRSGRFLASDLGWREGMSTWQPLSTFPELAGEIPPVAPVGAPGVAVSAVAPGVVVVARDGLPWEHRAQLGAMKAFIETVKLVLFQPSVAFSMMKTEGGMADPLLFALIGAGLGLFCYFFFTLLTHSIGFMSSRSDPFARLFGFGFGMVFCFLLIPVFVVVGVFIGALILHLCLMLVGGAKRSFETTLRVICFTCGSTNLLMIVPLCGGLIAGVWGIVVECIGLARAHETDTGRAVLAVILPIVLCCGGWILLAIFFGASAALLGHH